MVHFKVEPTVKVNSKFVTTLLVNPITTCYPHGIWRMEADFGYTGYFIYCLIKLTNLLS